MLRQVDKASRGRSRTRKGTRCIQDLRSAFGFRAGIVSFVAGVPVIGDFDPFGVFDLILGAYKLNLKIIEIPSRYRERTYGAVNTSRFRHCWLLLKMCLFAARRLKF